MELLKEMAQRLEKGEDETVPGLVERAIAEKIPPERILNEGLIRGMNVVGEQFREHEIFLPDVLLAAKAMIAGLEKLRPLLAEEGVPTIGKVVIGTVQGDLHDIGKNLVGVMLKGAGFDVVDLGKDVPPERFAEAAGTEGADFIGMSALLTTTMPVMKRVVELLKEKGLAGKVRIVVGGAPVSQEYAQEIGADIYAYDAASAVDRLKTAKVGG